MCEVKRIKELLSNVDMEDLDVVKDSLSEDEIIEIAQKMEIKDLDKLDTLIFLLANEEMLFYRGFSDEVLINYMEDNNYNFYFCELPTFIQENFDFDRFYNEELKYNIIEISTGFLTRSLELL